MTLDMTFERRMEIANENTERERRRADEAEKKVKDLTEQLEALKKQNDNKQKL